MALTVDTLLIRNIRIPNLGKPPNFGSQSPLRERESDDHQSNQFIIRFLTLFSIQPEKKIRSTREVRDTADIVANNNRVIHLGGDPCVLDTRCARASEPLV